MNAFKRKSLYVAVVAGLGALGASQAGAVNISTDNVGQVLLYPYYTTRSAAGNAWATSFTVVNTTTVVKVAKVRFLEGKNSAEVLDFNLWLSPKDVWAGQITDTGTGGKVATIDNSCTTAEGANIKTTGTPFSNLYYTGLAQGAPAGSGDLGGATLDRTREGYIEVIEMGQIVDLSSTVAVAVTHVAATAKPANCAVIQTQALNGAAPFTGSSTILAPGGGLTGNGIIINLTSGTESGYVPTVLANFSAVPIYSAPGDLNPNLSAVNPANSVVFVGGALPTVTDAGWANSIDAVSALFMHSSIINEYDVTASISAKTDLVMTAPTKRFYVFQASSGSATVIAPFANMFFPVLPLVGAPNATSCDPALVSAFDREEGPYSALIGIPVSPAPIGSGPNTINLCYESNVISVVPSGTPATSGTNPSSVYGSTNNGFIPLPASGSGIGNFNSGWVNLTPNSVNSGTAGGAAGGLRGAVGPTSGLRYRGLPVIGFAVVTAMASATDAQAGLGSTFANKYVTTITAP
jgi:hypothetical protein